MQLSLVAILLAITATVVSGAPAAAKPKKNTCDVAKCVADLAPTVAACAAAAAQDGIDPISDAACLTAASTTASKLPAPCNGCAAKLGVKLDSAKNAIEGLI
ncbi:hypothetical protein DFH08DRAFT_950397 [Mycena albidolilacea]|uniref:Fungal calcium binding protein domain-containing protein n=1 Tax=Mycena albidolilacea TaxID=1033008 RepID=A0AAD7AQ12_9AGAR|nr:hypothetical protein DFH08DRAFT_950397 [Mycena albidolilacea]